MAPLNEPLRNYLGKYLGILLPLLHVMARDPDARIVFGGDSRRKSGGKDNLGLTTVDLDAVWNITPHLPIIGYVLAGAGYAWANLDSPITGDINGRPVVLRDSNGFTANIGLGVKYYVMNNLYVNAEARYRYLNRLVSDSNQNLNTTETTVGIGWRF